MSTKEKLIEHINHIENEALLIELLNIIELETNNKAIYQLSAEETLAIEQGVSDIEQGRYYTQEEADKLIKQWFNEKSNGR
jgi:hypothetical protein